ncbi:UBA/THIF-type NAD/FAD binding protein [Magnetococcus marinus MC-1]|uniref:Molybdopterin-synthase adenylyltransferase n=1 Tax=Magnetococcus marinus (strain ATCC BAA-1437 / JCM 17883 / MC-1) TaxID=156889 RepID=A0L7R5_MAGMM|nr:HesA/MoeB/ThiF family protein [Magnetococcus marinus]ABK44008.1 UBA/THIF-type NAD/FAD binding protein [Magnetococcus marinus MC-1]
MFRDEQLQRYARNFLLKDVGGHGQQALLAAHVLIVGAGGLGSPVALYLAASGVGQLTLADADTVELSNLQRQVIHTTARCGENKSESAATTLRAINPDINITPLPLRLEGEALALAIEAADLVVDATDNFTSRYAINALCVEKQKKLVSGAVMGWEGQVAAFAGFRPGLPCYRCLYPPTEAMDALQPCARSGVLGPAAGVIGTLQAAEVIRQLVGLSEENLQRVTFVDLHSWRFYSMTMRAQAHCPVCGG